MANKKFYFTFGTDPQFPFYKGWVEVFAEDRSQAAKIFNSHFPPRQEGIVNCAFIYPQEEFEKTDMFTNRSWGGCHQILSANKVDPATQNSL